MGSESWIAETLGASQSGDLRAREELWPVIYDDLLAIAKRYMGRERAGHSLQPTAIVHEAFMRLVDVDEIQAGGRTHFLGIAAKAMRRILVEHARKHHAVKRGGGVRGTALHESSAMQWDDPAEVLALEEALEALAQVHPRQATVVELRFFGGMTLEETAASLGVSRDTVKLDWRFARAWLNGRLRGK